MSDRVRCPACGQGDLGTYSPEYITRLVERDEHGRYADADDYEWASPPSKGSIYECWGRGVRDPNTGKWLHIPSCRAIWHGPDVSEWEHDAPPPLTRIERGQEIQALFGHLLQRQVPECEKGPSATELSMRRDGRVVAHVNRYEPGCSDEDADMAAVELNRDKERL